MDQYATESLAADMHEPPSMYHTHNQENPNDALKNQVDCVIFGTGCIPYPLNPLMLFHVVRSA